MTCGNRNRIHKVSNTRVYSSTRGSLKTDHNEIVVCLWPFGSMICRKIHNSRSTNLPKCRQTTVCPEKKTKMFFCVIFPTKLGRFRWNLVHYLLSKFTAKVCKNCPPHLNTVSTLPCETWNVYHAGATPAVIVRERNSRIYPISTVASNFAGFESSWLQRVRILQENVYKTCITDLDELKQRLRTERAKLDMSSLRQPFVASSIAADH